MRRLYPVIEATPTHPLVLVHVVSKKKVQTIGADIRLVTLVAQVGGCPSGAAGKLFSPSKVG